MIARLPQVQRATQRIRPRRLALERYEAVRASAA